MAVDDQDFVGVRTHGVNDLGNETFFVPGGYHDLHAPIGPGTRPGAAMRCRYPRAVATNSLMDSIPLPLRLARDILRAHLLPATLPYKVTLVATYIVATSAARRGIWQKDSIDEMTPAEFERFFGQWSRFSWVHSLTSLGNLVKSVRARVTAGSASGRPPRTVDLSVTLTTESSRPCSPRVSVSLLSPRPLCV
jgi:hypothetical protein